jgi:hypothetical protein
MQGLTLQVDDDDEAGDVVMQLDTGGTSALNSNVLHMPLSLNIGGADMDPLMQSYEVTRYVCHPLVLSSYSTTRHNVLRQTPRQPSPEIKNNQPQTLRPQTAMAI